MTELALAIDIGGTKLAAGLVDRSGRLRVRAQVPTMVGDVGGTGGVESGGGAANGAEELWGHLAELVESIVTRAGGGGGGGGGDGGGRGDRIAVCGVGCGGPMSPGGATVSPLNIGVWREFPLRERLGGLTGLPTFVDNDAKALALSEGWVGAAAGKTDFMAMVVSTGVGGGVVLDGRLLEGRLGNAGHVGHVVVVPDGRACACGGKGCLEAEASGTAIAVITGMPARLAPAEVVERTGTLVGRAAASVANLLDLPLVVVSGSVALGYGEPFFLAAQREIDLRCGLEFARGTRIIPGGLGDEGPLIGAARVGWLGLDRSHDGASEDEEFFLV